MAKPQFQDIIPPDRRSIKKIPIPDRVHEARGGIYEPRPEVFPPRSQPQYAPRPVAPAPTPQYEYEPAPRPRPQPIREEPRYEREEEEIHVPRPPREPQPHRRSKVPVVLTLGALLLLAGGLMYTFLPQVSGATITLIPKGETVNVNSTFSASKAETGELPYKVAVYEKDGKLTVPAGAEEFTQTKAKGVIRIFNNYSTSPQILVANTRFETGGKIFRIAEEITIPGKKGDTPGSIDATVTADAVGPDYNVGLADFTIPGFKGDPRYSTIFARSKEAIGGGFSGNQKKVDEAQVAAARQKIREELTNSLVKQMQQNIPENFVSPPNAYFIDFESQPNTNVADGVQITERATFHGLMFERSDLAQAISKNLNNGSANQNDFANTNSLAFLAKAGTSTKPWDSQTLTFSLSGTTTLIAAIDTDKLKDELAGKPRKSLSAILAGYPGVAQAEVVMRPFWKQSFPTTKSDITINVSDEPLPQ